MLHLRPMQIPAAASVSPSVPLLPAARPAYARPVHPACTAAPASSPRLHTPTSRRMARPPPPRSSSLQANTTTGEPQPPPPTAIPDQRVSVKLSLAAGSGKLDLTDCQLDTLPPELFELRDLEELSIAGNRLQQLPAEIGQLTALRRLQLAGNQLTALPGSLGQLRRLEGCWLGGNRLTALPAEMGQLTALRQLSLSGNCLATLPPELGGLTALQELEVAGNLLDSVPEELGSLAALKKLVLNGNRLTCLPETLGGLTSLQELWLMGNQLRRLPEALGALPALRQLSVADNQLAALPPSLGAAPLLEKLWAYGNQLSDLDLCPPPAAGGSDGPAAAAWRSLDSIWLEGNPLSAAAAGQLLRYSRRLPKLKSLGLDVGQLAGVEPALVVGAGASLKIGEVLGEGRGYFKLSPSPSPGPGPAATSAKTAMSGPAVTREAAAAAAAATAAATAAAAAAAGEAAAAAAAAAAIPQQPVLVVAFGSAPCVPNWGGLLGRLYGAARDDGDRAFDVLYVVDPSRSWYDGGEPGEVAYYAERLALYTRRYKHVVMLGDSMGATAALMFCEQATSVLAFCPQVDLAGASIRPGMPGCWLDALRERVIAAVSASSAEVTVLCGTWQHDIDQTQLLPADKVRVKVFSLDSHRLAVYLDAKDKLLPLVQDAIKHQLNLRTGNIRISNLF